MEGIKTIGVVGSVSLVQAGQHYFYIKALR